MTRATAIVVAMGLMGCAPKPSAKEACAKLEAAGIAKGCREDKPQAISGRAKEKYAFDLPSVPGKTGQVLSFADADAYDATVKAFEAAGMLAGTHRYGSAKALIFVQLNADASLDVGKKTKALVEGL